MFYFFPRVVEESKKAEALFISGLPFFVLPVVGDVLKVFFSKKGLAFFFEGLCFKTARKQYFLPDSSLRVINKIKGSSISMLFSFFYNRTFSLEFALFKKKQFSFRKAKLFYFIKQNKFFVKS